MLQRDPDPDVDQGQVVVEDVRAQRNNDDKPAGEGDRYEEEPGEPGGAQVPEDAGVQPAAG